MKCLSEVIRKPVLDNANHSKILTQKNYMKTINLAVAQFEPKDGDKLYNLSIINELTQKAKLEGADVISFHEMSVTAYTHLNNLSFEH